MPEFKNKKDCLEPYVDQEVIIGIRPEHVHDEEELLAKYTERITSRLFGEFEICVFAGKDMLFIAGGIALAPLRSVINYCRHYRDRYGKIDILVNNAVTRCACSSWELSMDDFDKSLRINASALFLLTRLVAEDMKKRHEGSIINVGSYMGMRGLNMTNYAGTDMYASSAWPSPAYFYEKGGMLNFTRFAASVLGREGIRVNCISPGGLLDQSHQERFIQQYSANTFLGRLANETDLQGVIVFLASAASLYITGVNIPVDGGYTAK